MLTPLELAEIMHSQSQSESQFAPGSGGGNYNSPSGSGPNRGPIGSSSNAFNNNNNLNNNYNGGDGDDEEGYDENGRGFDSPVDDYRGAPVPHHSSSNNNLPPPLIGGKHYSNGPQQNYHNSPPRVINGPRGNNYQQVPPPPPPPAPAPSHHQSYNGPRPYGGNNNYNINNNNNPNSNFNYNNNNNGHRSASHPQPGFGQAPPNYQRNPSNNNNNNNNDYDRPYENEADYDRPYDGPNNNGNNNNPYDGRNGDYERGPQEDQSIRGYRIRSPSYHDDPDVNNLPPPTIPPPHARQPTMYSTMNRFTNNGNRGHQMDNSNTAPISAAGGYDEGPRNSAPIPYHGNNNNNLRPDQPPNRPSHWSYNSMHNRSPAPVTSPNDADESEDNGESDRDDPRPVEYRRAPSENRPSQTSLYGYYNSNEYNKNVPLEHENDESHRRRRRRQPSNNI